MIWNDLRGRDTQIAMFRQTLKRKRLASAYLFVGPDGTGKALFARKLAQCLFCREHPDELLDACGRCSDCRQMQSGSHPDFLEIGLRDGKREILIEQMVGGQEERGRAGLCFDLSFRPMSADRRVAVINDADLMNEPAANAFLKTLEEPPEYALLFLVASNPDTLLPTIRSRCQMVRFPPLSSEDVASLLLEKGDMADAGEAATVAALSEGSLTTARQLLDPQLRQIRDRLYAALAAPRLAPALLAKELISALEEIGGDAASQRRKAIWVLQFWLEFYRQWMRRIARTDGHAASVSTVEQAARATPHPTMTDYEKLLKMFDRTAESIGQIDGMTPVPLCLESLASDLGKLQRGESA